MFVWEGDEGLMKRISMEEEKKGEEEDVVEELVLPDCEHEMKKIRTERCKAAGNNKQQIVGTFRRQTTRGEN